MSLPTPVEPSRKAATPTASASSLTSADAPPPPTASCATQDDRAPVQTTLRRVGDKWSVIVLTRLLEHDRLRFTDLQRRTAGISHRMLTHTLRVLEQDGLLSRTAFAESPPRVEYTLTEVGRSFLAAIERLAAWVENNAGALRPGTVGGAPSVRQDQAASPPST